MNINSTVLSPTISLPPHSEPFCSCYSTEDELLIANKSDTSNSEYLFLSKPPFNLEHMKMKAHKYKHI